MAKKEKYHVSVKSYDNYVVGTCVEYPGVIQFADSVAKLRERFASAIPEHIEVLGRHGQTADSDIEVLSITT